MYSCHLTGPRLFAANVRPLTEKARWILRCAGCQKKIKMNHLIWALSHLLSAVVLIRPANLSVHVELKGVHLFAICHSHCLDATTPELIRKMSTGSLPWDLLILFFFLHTCPFSWTCLQKRSGYWRRERQGQCSVIMWVKRAAAKLDVMSTSRREEGERSGRWETALTDRKLCSQDWQLEQPMDNHQDGITSGIFFNLHYTKHGGHNFLSEARFSLKRFTTSQNTTSKFETRITQQQQRLHK